MKFDLEPKRVLRAIEYRVGENLSRLSPFSTTTGGPVDPEAVAAALKCFGVIAAGAAGILVGAEASAQSKGLPPGEGTRLIFEKGKEFFKGKGDSSKKGQ